MALLLHAYNLGKHFAGETLFKGLNFSIQSGNKIGLIGPNGAGKSTFLKCLAGILEPDEGEIKTNNKNRIVYLEQSPEHDQTKSVLQILREAALKAHTEDQIEGIVRTVLGKTQFPDPEAKAGTLSGGWQKKLAIASALVQEPDLLLLDEPTNHLDILGIMWLENLLKNANFTWLVISHDRYFLEKTCTRILEINPTFDFIITEGPYSQHLIQRQESIENQARQNKTLENKVRREKEWLARGPKARSTKAQARIDLANNMIDRLSQNKAKANISNVPQLQFQSSDRQSKKLVEFAQVAKAFENKTLYKDLSFNLSRGNVLGVLGANGSGKSTLLKLILDQLKPDSGKVWVSEHARIAYFDQMRSTLDLNDTLKTSLAPDSDSVVFQNNAIHVITWAKRFGFDSKQLGTKVGELSGGEKARLCLAKLMLMHADILLLDEPTNDLDIESLEALEDAINSFPAAIILISHDRYLLNNVCDIFLGLVPNQGALQFADYEQWAQAVDNQQDNKKSSNIKKEREPSKPAKLSYNEQRELQNIEKSILKAENKLEALTQATSEIKEGISADDLQKIFKEMADAQEEVDMLYQRWEELEILSKSFAR